MNKLATDRKLFILCLWYIPLSVLFLVFFSLLLGFSHHLSEVRIAAPVIVFAVLWIASYVWVFIYSYKNKKQISETTVSEDVLEKKELAYNISMTLGWTVFPVIYVWYVYKQSGATKDQMEKVIRDYNISQMAEIIEIPEVNNQIDKFPKLKQKINDVKYLYSTNFISFDEYITYLWEILENNNIKYQLVYDEDAIEKMTEIIETY